MLIRKRLVVSYAALFISISAMANETVQNTKIVQLGAYQDGTTHFVWLSSGTVSSCLSVSPTIPVIHFNESQPGGSRWFRYSPRH